MSGDTSAVRKGVGSEGLPAHWMDELPQPIPFKKRLTVTKRQLEGLQRPTEDLRIQLWATGMLHSPGYQGELARTQVTRKDGTVETVDLTLGLAAHELATRALEFLEEGGVDTDQMLHHLKKPFLRKFPEPFKLPAKQRRQLKIYMLRRKKQKLREAMEELELAGFGERRTPDGRKLRDLPLAEKRRFPSGNIRLFFFLLPLPADRKLVENQWTYTLECLRKAAEESRSGGSPAGATCSPIFRKVINLFGMTKEVSEQQLTDPGYQKKLQSAYDAAKKAFQEVLQVPEVAPTGLPNGASGGLRQVAGRGECIKSSNPKSKGQPSGPSESSSPSSVLRTGNAQVENKSPTTIDSSKKYASDKDELIALMEATSGRRPGTEVVQLICETVELRGKLCGGTLREYLEDIKPRLERLKVSAQEGFYVSQAKKWGRSDQAPAPAPETAEEKEERSGPCKKCRGLGKAGEEYCTCQMGQDLARVERKKATAAGGQS